MDLAPSEVREIIRAEHKQIELLLAEMKNLIQDKKFPRLKDQFLEFSQVFLNHIGKEERILRPVLKDLDSWGDVRVERMNKEHKEQRATVARLKELVAGAAPAEYLPRLEKFFEELHLDIAMEEKEYLNPNVMKDDPITIGGITG